MQLGLLRKIKAAILAAEPSNRGDFFVPFRERATMRVSIPHDWHVPGTFLKRLGDSVGRQRAMQAEGHLLLILHEPPVPGVAERKGRLFWRDPEGSWRSKPLGDGPQALKRHVNEFGDRVE
jgi:hypothetical protein